MSEKTIMRIPLRGIVRNTAPSAAPDGEMDDIINLRHKYGSYIPVGEPINLTNDIVNYSDIYIHTCVYRHVIGVKNGILYWFADIVDDPNSTHHKWVWKKNNSGTIEAAELCSVSGKPQYTQTGHLLTVSDDSGLSYILFNNKEKKYIESNPELDYNGKITSTSLPPEGLIDIRSTAAMDGDNFVYAYKTYTLAAETSLDDYKDFLKGAMSETFNISKANNLLSGGYRIIVSAIELYDGTHILHSRPILLDPPCLAFQEQDIYDEDLSSNDVNMIMGDFADLTDAGDMPLKYINNASYCYISMNQEVANNKYHVGEDETSLYTFNSVTLRKSYTIEVTEETGNTWKYPAKTFQLKDFKEYAKTPAYFNHIGVTPTTPEVGVANNKIQVRLNNNIPESYKDLIVGVSFFLSDVVDAYKFSNKSEYVTVPEQTPGSVPPVPSDELHGLDPIKASNGYYTFFPLRDADDIVEDLQDIRMLYKVASISFDEIKAKPKGEWFDLQIKDGVLSTLTEQERLDVDGGIRASFSGKIAYPYNGRLHIANLSEGMFMGFPMNYFFHNAGYGQYNDPTRFIKMSYSAYISVEIEGGFRKVYRKSFVTQTNNIPAIMPILSYPDASATKITILIQAIDFSTQIPTKFEFTQSFDLTPHKTYNTAQWISPTLKPTKVHLVSVLEFSEPPTEENTKVEDRINVIKVSAVDNPLYFPPANTYQIGNSPIIGFSSNATQVSEGQFGDTPLFVFSEDGIYGLFVDASGQLTYTNSRPITRDICNNSRSITTVEGQILFTTDRGLMMLNGAQVQDLSNSVEGLIFPFFDSTKIEYCEDISKCLNHVQLVDLLKYCNDNVKFLDYIKGACIGYNYKDKELWVSNAEYNYSYIMHNGEWTKRTITYKEIINDYPRIYGLNQDNIIERIEDEDTSRPTQTMFLTRPIKLDSQSFKQNYRAILRSYLDIQDIISEEYREIVYDGSNEKDTVSIKKGEKVIIIFDAGYEDLETTPETHIPIGTKIYAYPDIEGGVNCTIKSLIGRSHVEESMKQFTPDDESVYAGFYLLGSYDCKKWVFIGGRELEGVNRDIGLLAHRADCKYYRFLFVGRLKKDSTLDHIESTVSSKILSGKLR